MRKISINCEFLSFFQIALVKTREIWHNLARRRDFGENHVNGRRGGRNINKTGKTT
jgi:hypothetical protein